jgi:hypothetical protein
MDHPNRKPRREFRWRYGAPDSLGERRGGQHHDNHRGHEYRPRRDRDDQDGDNGYRGVRRHCSQSSWGRMTRCGGGADDCYSTTTRYYGDNQRNGGYRSRDNLQKETTWRRKSSGKRVSFANPLISFCGEQHPSHDPSIQLI